MPAADRLSHLLDPVLRRLAGSPLPGYGRDARLALLSLLPGRWRGWVEGNDQRLLLLRAGDEVELIAAGNRGDTVLGRLPLDDAELLDAAHTGLAKASTPRWLLLPEAQVLRRRLSLPVAAEPRLREVLTFELDRQTPFSAEQVSFHGRVLGRDSAGQQLDVELLVLPKARLDAELQPLGALARELAGVDVLDPHGRRLGVNLLPDSRREQRVDPVRRLNLVLAAVAAVSLLATLLLTLHNRSERLEQLSQQVTLANEQVRQARVLRNQLQSSAQAANFLATLRASRPTMLELLDDLTRRIPDNTSLDKLTIGGGRVVMVGQSLAAPALVAQLQASSLLVDPALSGSVQADPRSGRDRFTLTAAIADQGATGEAADARRP